MTSGGAAPTGSTLKAGGFIWRFSLEYEHTVNNETFKGNNIKNTAPDITAYIKDSHSREVRPQKLLGYQEKYSVGTQMKISHSRSRPEESFIEIESRTRSTIILEPFGSGFLGITLILLRAFYKKLIFKEIFEIKHYASHAYYTTRRNLNAYSQTI